MYTYAIGDVQGCFDELQALLAQFNFNANRDCLWFLGDLVNRGTQSLQVLRFIKNLPNVKVVLGNHDIHLLALAYGNYYPHHTLDEVLQAPDCKELIDWLRHLSLLHFDAKLNYVMVHAGLPPQWNLAQAMACARELELALRDSENIGNLLSNLYGDEPKQWRANLAGWERLRFITNAFTRIRYCTAAGELEFLHSEKPGTQPARYLPWFKVPNRLHAQQRIIFGHWSALQGETGEPNAIALDTGCVWGNALTAMRLEDSQKFSVPCRARTNSKKR